MKQRQGYPLLLHKRGIAKAMAIFLRLLSSSIRDAKGRDIILCLLILILSFIGLVSLQSTSSMIGLADHKDLSYFVKKQALWLALALLAFLFFSNVSLEIVRKFSTFGMWIGFVLLCLVFVPGIGHGVQSIHGSFDRWISIGGLNVQPSELCKVLIICFVSAQLSNKKLLRSPLRVAQSIVLTLAMLIIILIEPQYGTTLCITAVLFVAIYIFGFPVWRLFLIILSIAPIPFLLAYFWQYRWTRIQVWLDPYAYRYEAGYQLVRSFKAFESGSWLGQDLASGLGHRYLTYGHTDFVMPLLAEDFGYVGILGLFFLFGLFLWRGIILLQKVSDSFAFLLGSSALVMLFCQIILNMMVVTGMIPTTGIGLAFFSYGGSYLITTLALCGILVNATRRPQKLYHNP